VRNGLNPETQYFYKGYATNPGGTGLSPEGNFYTLSAPPASAVTNYAGTPILSAEIDLTWSAATFPVSGATATGYVILRRNDMSNPTTTGFVNGTNPAGLTFPAGTTLVTTITSGATVMYNNTGLSANTQYNYLIVPFTWDNVHAVTYNYYLTSAATCFATTFPAPPVVTTPTSASITNNSALLGANVTSGGPLTERGTVYKTSTGVMITDNPLAEGGTSTGVFTHTRNGLDPQTQYFFKGYAINSGGTGLSPEGNFRTLSNPPLSEVTNFTATPFSSTQIDLTWTAANFPSNGATANGYLIIRRVDTNPTTSGIANAKAPSTQTLPNGTLFIVGIASGATTMYSNSGLTGNSTYYYLIVPFTWDGTNTTTYHYYLNNAAVASATTLFPSPIVWINNTNSTPWYTTTNWNPNTTSSQWTLADIGQFQAVGSATVGINLNTANLNIAAIEVTSARTASDLTLGNSSTTVSGTITLNGATINAFSNTILRNNSSKNLTIQNFSGGNSSQTMDVVLNNVTNNAIYIDGAGNITITSIIKGTSKLLSLNGIGSGILNLNAVNTFSGGFTLNGATVSGGNTDAFGTGTLTLNGGTLSGSSSLTFANSITIGGNFSISGTNAVTYSGAVNLGAASRTITNSLTSGSRIFSGIISGASGSGITFNGSSSGIIYLSGANIFTGDININGGEVGFPNTTGFGNAANTIVLDGGRITSSTTAAGSITATWPSSHAIQVGTNGGSINVVGAPGDLTYDGVIDNKPAATGALIKQGAGILRLGGTSAYTGATTINNGTLQLTTASNRLPVTTTLNFGQGSSANLGALDMNSLNQEVAGINSIAGTNGTVSNNLIVTGLATTLTLSGSGTYSFGDGYQYEFWV
jgi:autotransporter-associated beta strand protein